MAWNGSDSRAAVEKKPQVRKARIPMAAWLAAGALAAAAVGWLVVGSRGTDTAKEKAPASASTGKIRKNAGRFAGTPEEVVRKAMPSGLAEKPRRKRMRPTDLFGEFEGKDRALAEAVQTSLDAEDLKGTLAAAKAALKSENPALRQNAVEALGWFGAAALPELTGCMADPDEDVRQAAANQWELAAEEIEAPADRFSVVSAAFATLSGEDELTSLGGLLGNAAAEMIDNEDDPARASDNRVAVLQSLVDIIEEGRPANVAAAKEAYNDITGNEWLGIDEAERYLADPDNYDPDERPAAAQDAEGADA